ncbi:hypothetical protein FHS26_002747 [Rhizobium pisi]|uniref:Uncharacterized protein n=1 Tax=Rhizobium pisi TaxID=574561 RepID=A0A7W5BLQ5_9HYPH|nr:hypothetical protein [Rhizobium pisi]
MSFAGNIFHGRSSAGPKPILAVATPPAGKTMMVVPPLSSRTASCRLRMFIANASRLSSKEIGSE